jgi:hypothetical protein
MQRNLRRNAAPRDAAERTLQVKIDENQPVGASATWLKENIKSAR